MAATGGEVGLSRIVPASLGGAFEGGGDGQEGVGDQGDHAPAVPGVPAGDLAFVEVADFCLHVFGVEPDDPEDGTCPNGCDTYRGLRARSAVAGRGR